MRNLSFNEYCDELAEYYKGYKTEDTRLRKLVVTTIHCIKNRANKEIRWMLSQDDNKGKDENILPGQCHM